MKKLSFEKADKAKGNLIALKGGAYSAVVTIIVLAILIVCNVLASMLPPI